MPENNPNQQKRPNQNPGQPRQPLKEHPEPVRRPDHPQHDDGQIKPGKRMDEELDEQLDDDEVTGRQPRITE